MREQRLCLLHLAPFHKRRERARLPQQLACIRPCRASRRTRLRPRGGQHRHRGRTAPPPQGPGSDTTAQKLSVRAVGLRRGLWLPPSSLCRVRVGRQPVCLALSPLCGALSAARSIAFAKAVAAALTAFSRHLPCSCVAWRTILIPLKGNGSPLDAAPAAGATTGPPCHSTASRPSASPPGGISALRAGGVGGTHRVGVSVRHIPSSMQRRRKSSGARGHPCRHNGEKPAEACTGVQQHEA